MRSLRPVLGIAVAVGVLVLSLVGAGLYLLVPLGDDPEQPARTVVEDFVDAWAAGRCTEVTEYVVGADDLVAQECRQSAARRTGTLELEDLDLSLDGRRGTADLHLVLRSGDTVERSTVTQELVRRGGLWRLAWR